MLVLKRKAGEAIIIGDNIEVRVLRLDGDHVRLGIIAPQMVTVLRSELLEEVRNETQASAVMPAELSQVQLLSQRLKGLTAKKK
jgi:carbon storage regulator